MNPDTQHNLAHARELADSAARLVQSAQAADSRALRAHMEATASRLLTKVDRLLEDAA